MATTECTKIMTQKQVQAIIFTEQYYAIISSCPGGVIGSHARLKILWP